MNEWHRMMAKEDSLFLATQGTKRSADNNQHPLTRRQLRIKAEEQRYPTLQIFGKISSSGEQRDYHQYQQQMGTPSKQLCQLSPSFSSTQSFQHGQAASSNQPQSYPHSGARGGSFGGGQNGGSTYKKYSKKSISGNRERSKNYSKKKNNI